MGVLILRRNTQGGTDYLETLSDYMKYDRKTGNIRDDFVTASGYGVDIFDMELAFFQMLQVKKYFGKTSGNPLLHYIFSFDSKVKNESDAIWMSMKIAEYFQDRYQVLWALHRKKRNGSFYHVHLMVNSVSYVDGRMIDSWMTEIEKFRLYVRKVTGSWVRFQFAGDKDDV